jgi:hypothetical protein
LQSHNTEKPCSSSEENKLCPDKHTLPQPENSAALFKKQIEKGELRQFNPSFSPSRRGKGKKERKESKKGLRLRLRLKLKRMCVGGV